MAAELIDNYLLDKRFMRELEDEEYIKELIKFPEIIFQNEKKGENITVSASKKDPKNKKQIEIKTGKRGGRYTEDTTEEGRPYRRYF